MKWRYFIVYFNVPHGHGNNIMAASLRTHGLLTDRVTSSFPLSIGTALAFESIFDSRTPAYDPLRTPPIKINIGTYNQLWVNLATLFRNIVGAVTKERFLLASPQEFQEVLSFEIEVIESLLANEGMGRCKPVFYYADYPSFLSLQGKTPVKMRRDTTDDQRSYSEKLKGAIDLFFKTSDHQNCVWMTSNIRPDHSVSALILTHVPYDLLSYPFFRQLDLIESHQGKLKTRMEWYTKLYPVPGTLLNTIPFIESMLFIFGDREMIHPMDIRIRKDVVQLSLDRHWNALTTDARVRQSVELSQNQVLIDLFRYL